MSKFIVGTIVRKKHAIKYIPKETLKNNILNVINTINLPLSNHESVQPWSS